MASIVSYEQWMRETAGAVYERRNSYLQALDKAIQAFHQHGQSAARREEVIRCLNAYVSDHDKRKGIGSWKKSIRNKNQSMERLMAAFVTGPVPIVSEPPKAPPAALPPPPVRVIVNPMAQAVIDQLKEEFSHNSMRFKTGTSSSIVMGPRVAELDTALGSMAIDLNKLYGEIHRALDRTRTDFLAAIERGFLHFENVHKDDAEDINFKTSIAKAVFGAMKSLPFPLSAIGSAGEAVTGALKTETFNRHAGALGECVLPTSDSLLSTVKAAADNFRTLNVPPGKLKQNLAQMRQLFDVNFREFETRVGTSWSKATESVDDAKKRLELAQATAKSLEKLRTNSEMTIRIGVFRRELEIQSRSVKERFAPFTNIYAVDPTAVGIWVTVLLIADYAINGLCGGQDVKKMAAEDLANKKFGQKFAEFLARSDVGILELKTDGLKSAAIYAGGKIPWDGHPAHIVAVLLYLDWVQRNINPFDLFRPGCTVNQFKDRSRDYIERLGQAIQAHQESHWFGHKTITDVAGVVAQADRPRSLTAEEIFAAMPSG